MRKIWSGFLMMFMLVLGQPAAAQWPEKPVTILVGYASGGLSDLLARVISEKLQARLGQPIVVDIKSGASGSIATAALARAKPDGYTFGIVTSNHATNPSLIKNLSYADKDFTGVSLLAKMDMVFVASAKATQAQDLAAFLAEGRANPGGILYASAGSGNMTHMSGELLADVTGQAFTQVPYRGGGAAILDLLGGQVPSQFVGVQTLMPQLQGEGQSLLRPLAVTSNTRVPVLPNVPTFTELGYPQLVISEWQALIAPAGTPADIVQTMSAHVQEILQLPDVRQRLSGVTIEGSTPQELNAFMQAERQRWSTLLAQRQTQQQ